MNKISKLLVMAVVVLAVITMSLSVNASTTDLINYVTEVHNINGMLFELTNSQKTAVRDYLSANSTDAKSDAAYAKIREAENLVSSSGVNRVSNLSKDVKTKLITLATEAANEVGLTLNVNTANNTFTLSNGNDVLASGSVESLITYQETPAGNAGAAAAVPGKTLLYTGSNYAVYGLVVLAIVAVAVVVKKRS